MVSVAGAALGGLLTGLLQAQETSWLRQCVLTKTRLDYGALRRKASSIVDGQVLRLLREKVLLLERLQATFDQKRALAK